MNTDQPITPARQATITSLAVVGFVALVVAGIWLAVYSTRFVPTVVNRVGSAAVYLGSVFTQTPKPSLSVVQTPVASTTISFGTTSSTIPTPVTQYPRQKQIPTTIGEKTNGTYQISGTTTTNSFSGLPDLVVTINSIGYLATSSAESFVASSTVPAGSRPAVRFAIKNIGTNATGQWRFSASIPTQSAYLYYSPFQQSLNPGDSIDYTLGFDQANRGSGQTVSVSANFDRAVTESNYSNNNTSTNLVILGG